MYIRGYAREGTFPCTIGFRFAPPVAIGSCAPGRTTSLSFLHIRGKRLPRLRDRLAPAGREVLLEQGRRAPVWISLLAAARARQSFGTLALCDDVPDVQSG